MFTPQHLMEKMLIGAIIRFTGERIVSIQGQETCLPKSDEYPKKIFTNY